MTTTGTLTITKANETANFVWAGPTTGAAAQPTFRALVAADIPATLRISTQTIPLTTDQFTVSQTSATSVSWMPWTVGLYSGYTGTTSYFSAFIIPSTGTRSITVTLVDGAGTIYATIGPIAGGAATQVYNSGTFSPTAITPTAANSFLSINVVRSAGTAADPILQGASLILVYP